MPKKSRKNKNNDNVPITRIEEFLEIQKKHDSSAWRIFRIMSEFVSGFEFLRNYHHAVTIFGSARTKPQAKIYKEAEHLAHKLSKEGFVIFTGGGPGIMEAANKGAYEAGGKSIGIGIKIPEEETPNRYMTEKEEFKYFFVRKTMLAYASEIYVFFPGGFGTLDEFFEILTLIKTNKIEPLPIILVNKEFWTPLLEWMEETLHKKTQNIDKSFIDIYTLVDTPDEAFRYIKQLKKTG